jgi:GNAT superfamily N-acetyltransferase
MSRTDLDARLACVQRTWTVRQRLHVGNVAWAGARADGSPVPDATLAWGDPLVGFADVWWGGTVDDASEASLHIAPDVSAARRAEALDELFHLVPQVTVEVSRDDAALVDALAERGLRPVDGPWFAQLWRSLTDLGDLTEFDTAGGYTIRAARRDEQAERVEVHRRSWAPARIRAMLGLPVTGDEPGSRYSADIHRAVVASPVYRAELDMVAVAADGSFAAYALGWLDPVSGSVLFEPVGTDPAHAKRGLARAVCAGIMRAARDLGATQAIVSPRGDNGYPVPRRVYAGLGMREVAQFVSLITSN